VFGGAIDVGSTSYINFLMADTFVQTVVFGWMSTGVDLAEDFQKGLAVRSLPIALRDYLCCAFPCVSYAPSEAILRTCSSVSSISECFRCMWARVQLSSSSSSSPSKY
jgi:hypothetical protein